MMTKREVIQAVLKGQKPPYVPWSCGFTKEAGAKLQAHYGTVELEDALQNHLLKLGSDIGFFTDLGNNHVRDVFGVVWDRSIDKDIGNVEGCAALTQQYRGRLVFHGGLSTQRTLPYGTVEDVRAETRRLLEMGREGGYIFTPAHDVEGDVPLETMLAFIEVSQHQPGYQNNQEQ